MSTQLEQIKTDQLNLGWYAVDEHGVIRYKTDPESTDPNELKSFETVCLTPMVPTAILENVDTGEEKVEISYRVNRRIKTLVIDRETLVNKNKVVGLARYGIAVGSVNSGKVAAFFTEVLGRSESLPRKLSKSSLGWVGSKREYFLPYSDGFVLDNQSDPHVIELIEAFKAKGDRDAWMERMRLLRKHMTVRVAMGASFASPIVSCIGQNPFIMHIWGGSGLGKTLLLKLIMSIWGNPNSTQLVRSLNTTQNALMSQASFLQHIPLAGDELQTIKTRYANYDNLIMDITEGANRGRLGPDGKPIRVLTWRNAFLTCGEEPICKQDSGGGAFARVVEIELLNKYVSDGNELANFLADNYGFAAQEFITELMRPVALGGYDLSVIYRDYFGKLMSDGTLNEKQAGAGALIMVADFIASMRFWKGEPELTADDMMPFLKSADTVDVTERAYKAVAGMVVQYSANFAEEPKEAWGRWDGNEVYILKSVLSERMLKMGFDWEACKKKWKNKGYIRTGRDGRMQHYVSICGHPAYCICFVMPKDPNESEELIEHNGEIPF